MATLYSTGLRCNEVRHLKVGDIDSQRMLTHVRVGKGRIPRDIGLSSVQLERVAFSLRRCGSGAAGQQNHTTEASGDNAFLLTRRR